MKEQGTTVSATSMLSPRQRAQRALIAPTVSLVVLTILGGMLDRGANGYTQLIFMYIMINIILALSLNLVNGFTGQFSIGHAGFMAIGAYVAGYFAKVTMGAEATLMILPPPFEFLNFGIFAIAGGLAAAVAGWFVGLPSLRLKGDYLAIVTLGFGEIIRVFLLNMDVVGGPRGLNNIPGPHMLSIGSLVFSEFFMNFLLASIGVMITFFTLWRLVHSTHGRGFMSVREDEIAAEAMGVNTTQMKVRAFVLSSFFAGVAGAIFAFTTHFLSPSTFQFTKSVDVIIMVVLGGMGSLTGSVVAAVIVTILPEFVLRPLQEITGVDLRMVIYSLLLIIFMVARPKGIFGRKEITDLIGSKNGATSA